MTCYETTELTPCRQSVLFWRFHTPTWHVQNNANVTKKYLTIPYSSSCNINGDSGLSLSLCLSLLPPVLKKEVSMHVTNGKQVN